MKKSKLISTGQIITYVIWFIFLFILTLYFSSKRNEYFQDITNKVENATSKYGYVIEENISNKKDLHYESGDDSKLWIKLNYNDDGYVLDHCEFEYDNYSDSSYKVDYYYDVINSILPEIKIYEYKDQIDYAIENKLYEENGSYMIDFTSFGKKGYIFIHDNTSDYFDYEYNISVKF